MSRVNPEWTRALTGPNIQGDGTDVGHEPNLDFSDDFTVTRNIEQRSITVALSSGSLDDSSVAGSLTVPGTLIGLGNVDISGSLFVSGSISAVHGYTGSHTRLLNGKTFLAGAGTITITTSSDEQVIITGVGGATTGTWRDPGNAFITTGSVSIDSNNRSASSLGTDVFFFVSGSVTSSAANQKTSLFGGDVVSSGSIKALQGFSGSHTRLADGRSALNAGVAITITTSSTNQITINTTIPVGANRVGVYSARPAPGNLGNDYYTTDSPIGHWLDDGIAWRPLIQGQFLGVEPPLSGALTSLPSGGLGVGSLTQVPGGLVIKDRGAVDANALIFSSQMVPQSGSYIEATFIHQPEPAGAVNMFHAQGLCAFESSTNKTFSIMLYSGYNGASVLETYVQTNVMTSLSASTVSQQNLVPGLDGNAPVFMRVRSGSTANTVCGDYSRDRITWLCVTSLTQSSAFTGRFNQMGVMAYSATGAGAFSANHKTGRAVIAHLASGTLTSSGTINTI